jgi:hypothetical protein
MERKHHFYVSGHRLSTSNSHHNFMCFLQPLLVLTFSCFMCIWDENHRFWHPLQIQCAPKWLPESPRCRQQSEKAQPPTFFFVLLATTAISEAAWSTPSRILKGFGYIFSPFLSYVLSVCNGIRYSFWFENQQNYPPHVCICWSKSTTIHKNSLLTYINTFIQYTPHYPSTNPLPITTPTHPSTHPPTHPSNQHRCVEELAVVSTSCYRQVLRAVSKESPTTHPGTHKQQRNRKWAPPNPTRTGVKYAVR